MLRLPIRRCMTLGSKYSNRFTLDFVHLNYLYSEEHNKEIYKRVPKHICEKHNKILDMLLVPRYRPFDTPLDITVSTKLDEYIVDTKNFTWKRFFFEDLFNGSAEGLKSIRIFFMFILVLIVLKLKRVYYEYYGLTPKIVKAGEGADPEFTPNPQIRAMLFKNKELLDAMNSIAKEQETKTEGNNKPDKENDGPLITKV